MAAPTTEQHVMLQERVMSGRLWAELRASQGGGEHVKVRLFAEILLFCQSVKICQRNLWPFPP